MKRGKQAKKKEEPKANSFEELKQIKDSPFYVRVRSWLWHNDYENPVRHELWEAVAHSYSPNPIDYDFSDSAKETIFKVYLIFEKEKERIKEEKRAEAARKRRRRK